MLHSGKRTIDTMKNSRLFWIVACALVFLFLLVQVHEFIPGLHEEGNPENPDEHCPLCVIKYVLSLALFITGILYIYGKRHCKIAAYTTRNHSLHRVPFLPARAPPF
ncbi:MAG: hypothetical protein KAH38_00660 [Candidatus Hydrogenedentes bacterium]|nr:hypothetical protein [Candidatus Hydrogenedentota bacterium]